MKHEELRPRELRWRAETTACDRMHVTSATFDFSHPSNLSVNHPASPATAGLSHGDTERLVGRF